MFWSTTEGEFFVLTEKVRHKKAAFILRDFYDTKSPHMLALYRRVEGWMRLPLLNTDDFQHLSDRYHLHLKIANVAWQEYNLLAPSFLQPDCPSNAPFLPVSIYLDNIRSAFNVGSILRTAEAFRLGTVCFAHQTPYIDNIKVQKTSMGSFDKVPCRPQVNLEDLPRPLIALETSPEAPSVFDFEFPPEFTLMLGNEEYGLSQQALAHRDAMITIPLFGYKNSLNVASAFAIVAAVISDRLRH